MSGRTKKFFRNMILMERNMKSTKNVKQTINLPKHNRRMTKILRFQQHLSLDFFVLKCENYEAQSIHENGIFIKTSCHQQTVNSEMWQKNVAVLCSKPSKNNKILKKIGTLNIFL